MYGYFNPQSEPGIIENEAFAVELTDTIQEEWMSDEVNYELETNACVASSRCVQKLKEQGFNTIWERRDYIEDKNNEYASKYNEDCETLGKYLDDAEKASLETYASNIANSATVGNIQENEKKYNKLIDKAETAKKEEEARIAAEKAAAEKAKKQNAYYNGTGGKLTKSKGVNYYNGRRETYYSSRVLYHYMTPQWTLGSDRVYRENGYVVVAASDLSYGSLVDTSLGMGIVRDCGCAPGTTDIYVNW